ncbi:hypothetical protein B0A48_18291 [Cryoendolithus antarcticus]|uniref:Uncharacterized protein n=1 Tax=Cryoendolithus antarcticus TaxID=1507870 RepID=A0A1V8S8W5_9PEZI|nr:hypothetical protein B0A48_18291 [Cryoendolithus antarcticus]
MPTCICQETKYITKAGAPPRPDFAIEAEVVNKPERRYRHKRRQYHSDSSIIVPLAREAPEHDRDATHGRSRESDRERHERRERDSVSPAWPPDRRQPSAAKSRSARASPEPVTKTYERRPRHKTKADRYEPKKKKSKQERPTDGQDAQKSRRRKLHRSGDGFRTAGLVQSFQLKNGGKSGRLTLKTDGTAGVFSHGRASTQLPGKNTGLPDLVFNEMRFLHKIKVPAENLVEPESRKLSKQDAKRQIENGEISAYFDALTAGPRQQSPVASMHLDESARKLPASVLHSVPTTKAPQPGELNARSTKLLSVNRPAADHADQQTHSTSCFTWSQSDPRPAPRQRLGAIPGIQGASNPGGKSLHDDENHGKSTKLTPEVHALQAPVDLPGRGAWMVIDRAPADLHVEMNKPHVDANPAPRHRTTSRTSLSLPRLPGRPLEPDIRSAAANSTSADPSTPDILRLRSRMLALAQDQDTRLADTENLPSDEENLERDPTSPTAKLLRTAGAALDEAPMLQPDIRTAKAEAGTIPDWDMAMSLRRQRNAIEPNDTYLEAQDAYEPPDKARRFRHEAYVSSIQCRPPTGVAFGLGMGISDHCIWGAPQSEAAPWMKDDEERMLEDQPDYHSQNRFGPLDWELLQQAPTSGFSQGFNEGSTTMSCYGTRAASFRFQDPPSVQSTRHSLHGQFLWPASRDEYAAGYELRPSFSRGGSTRFNSGHGAMLGSGRSLGPLPPVPLSESSGNVGLHRLWG